MKVNSMKKQSDIPFSTDSSMFFIPWLCMFMVFIATLMLAIALTTHSSISRWTAQISGEMTIQIPTHTKTGVFRDSQIDTDIENTLAILRTSDGILNASLLSSEQMTTLMKPWFSGAEEIDKLPFPKIVDIKVDTNNLPNIHQIKIDLKEQVPFAILDSHRLALADLINISHNVIELILFLLFLLLLTSSISIIYTTHSSLSVHQHIVQLIHMMGGRDFYITIQFALRSFKLAFIGSYVGFALALPIILIFSNFIQRMSDSFIIQIQFSPLQWGMLALLPLIASLLAFATAYQTVSKSLKKIL